MSKQLDSLTRQSSHFFQKETCRQHSWSFGTTAINEKGIICLIKIVKAPFDRGNEHACRSQSNIQKTYAPHYTMHNTFRVSHPALSSCARAACICLQPRSLYVSQLRRMKVRKLST